MDEDMLKLRKRRIRFRAAHRGMKELDLLFSRLAEEVLEELDEAGVAEFERLLEVPDAVVLAWVAREEEPPAEYDGPLLRRLLAYEFGPRDYGHNL